LNLTETFVLCSSEVLGLKPHEHDSALGQWQAVQRSADPRLRGYVHGYFASSSLLKIVVRERHLPSVEVPLLLNFGAPHRRLDGLSGSGWTKRDGAWVVGLHDRHLLSEAVGERHFMVVRFTPIGAHLFLRTPMNLVANQAIDLADIDSNLARLLLARVGAMPGWSERFDAVEALIMERILSQVAPLAIGSAFRTLESAHGRVPLGWLASEAACSHRHLIAQFRTFVGLPPKTVARLLRFNRAMRALHGPSHRRRDEPAGKPYIEAPTTKQFRVSAISWADVAADCGYADQAHFTKEFREFSGSTPAQFLREVLDDA
jgi:AraC-like DNA-binding protein